MKTEKDKQYLLVIDCTKEESNYQISLRKFNSAIPTFSATSPYYITEEQTNNVSIGFFLPTGSVTTKSASDLLVIPYDVAPNTVVEILYPNTENPLIYTVPA